MAILDESVEPASLLDAPSKLQYFLDVLRPILSKTVVALVVIMIGFIAGKLIGKILQWFLRTAEVNMRWKDITGTNFRIEEITSGMMTGAIYFITVIMALNVLGFSEMIAKIISFGIISLIIISMILAGKDFIPNYVDGLRMYKRVRKNDMISVDNIKGKVEEITWTDIKMTTENGDTLYIPHSVFLKKGFKKREK